MNQTYNYSPRGISTEVLKSSVATLSRSMISLQDSYIKESTVVSNKREAENMTTVWNILRQLMKAIWGCFLIQSCQMD